MAGGFNFNPAAFGTGLLGTMASNVQADQAEQRKQDDYAAQLAAKSAQAALDQQNQEKTDAKNLAIKAQALANSSMQGYGDVLPGHVAAAHDALVLHNGDISKLDPDAMGILQDSIRKTGDAANRKLAQRAAGPYAVTPPSAYNPVQQPQQSSAQNDNPWAVPESMLQPGDTGGIRLNAPNPALTPGYSAPMAQDLTTLSGQPTHINIRPEQWATLQSLPATDADRAAARAVIEGRLPLTRAVFSKPADEKRVRDLVMQADSTFDFNDTKLRADTIKDFSSSGQSGRLVTSMNAATQHAAQMSIMSLGLANHSGFPGATTLNEWQNNLSKSSGSNAVTNPQALMSNLAPEIAKVTSGKTNFPYGESEDVKSKYNLEGGSAQQIIGALSTHIDAMGARAREMQQQYDDGTKGMGSYKVVRPDVKQASEDIQALSYFAKHDKLDTPEAQAVIQRVKFFANNAPYVKQYNDSGENDDNPNKNGLKQPQPPQQNQANQMQPQQQPNGAMQQQPNQQQVQQPQQQQSGPPKVATPQDYEAIQPGATYMDPNGNLRQKPKPQQPTNQPQTMGNR